MGARRAQTLGVLKGSTCFLPISFKGNRTGCLPRLRGGGKARVTWASLFQGSLVRWTPCSEMSNVNNKRLRPRQQTAHPQDSHPVHSEVRVGRKGPHLTAGSALQLNRVSLPLSPGACSGLCKFVEGGKVVGAGVGVGCSWCLLCRRHLQRQDGSARPAQGTGLAASSGGCGEEVCTQHLAFVLKKKLSCYFFLESHYGKISKNNYFLIQLSFDYQFHL